MVPPRHIPNFSKTCQSAAELLITEHISRRISHGGRGGCTGESLTRALPIQILNFDKLLRFEPECLIGDWG